MVMSRTRRTRVRVHCSARVASWIEFKQFNRSQTLDWNNIWLQQCINFVIDTNQVSVVFRSIREQVFWPFVSRRPAVDRRECFCLDLISAPACHDVGRVKC